MELSGKRVVVFIDNSYQELEVWYPYLRFREAGINVVFAAADSGETYSSKYGYPAKADKSYDELSVSDYDVYQRERQLDFAFFWGERARFRANAFFQKDRAAIALRLIPTEIPTPERIGHVVVRGGSPDGVVVRERVCAAAAHR